MRDAVERQKAAQTAATASKPPSIPSTTPPTPKKVQQTSPRMWRPPGTAPVSSPPQTAAARPYIRNRSAAGAAAPAPGVLLPPISGNAVIRQVSAGSRSAVAALGTEVESVSIEKPNSGSLRRSSFRRSIGKDGGSGGGSIGGSGGGSIGGSGGGSFGGSVSGSEKPKESKVDATKNQKSQKMN